MAAPVVFVAACLQVALVLLSMADITKLPNADTKPVNTLLYTVDWRRWP
jgi:hypothetical protein